MSDIRIVVVLTDANPELVAEFEKISPRARAERMRVLATLGQQLGNQRRASGLVNSPSQAPSPASAAQKSTSEKAALPLKSSPTPAPATGSESTRTDEVEVGSSKSDSVSARPSRPQVGSRVARFAASLGKNQ